MEEREMLLKTLRREGFEKIHGDIVLTPPKMAEFEEISGGKTVEEYFGLSHRAVFPAYLPSYEGDGRFLFGGEPLPDRFEVDAFGVGASRGSDEAYHMVHFHSPLAGEDTSLERIESYPLPRFSETREEDLQREISALHGAGYAAMGWMEQTIWERAWLIRGMNELMMEMMAEDDRASLLLDRITDHSCATATMLARAGSDIIALGDDIGMQSSLMMSPELWRAWLKPRLAKVIETIRSINPEALIFYHSCGYITPLIGDLVEVGVDILNPVQPECMDFASVHAEWGRRLSFWGGIGTQTTLPFGRPEEVDARVRELVAICGEKGGIVPAPTHVVEPEVPWENLEAFRRALLE